VSLITVIFLFPSGKRMSGSRPSYHHHRRSSRRSRVAPEIFDPEAYAAAARQLDTKQDAALEELWAGLGPVRRKSSSSSASTNSSEDKEKEDKVEPDEVELEPSLPPPSEPVPVTDRYEYYAGDGKGRWDKQDFALVCFATVNSFANIARKALTF